jgi:hypothetical protein
MVDEFWERMASVVCDDCGRSAAVCLEAWCEPENGRADVVYLQPTYRQGTGPRSGGHRKRSIIDLHNDPEVSFEEIMQLPADSGGVR